MAGEPVLIAQNCALVIVGDTTCRSALASEGALNLSQLTSVAGAISAPFIDLVHDGDFVVDDELLMKIAENSRRTLILCGGWLEGAVTQIALLCLLEGYDVYVYADQLVTGGLRRAGVSPTHPLL